ncbi:hypothetical protein IAR55_002892 [Kwoniella newhampshirensis]|uniref:CobW/HypB/UreG nucleotide-binding domain-containing protein n=1 Tax=Kwoniella newhampshirensis TaxID=1651941 RepID=A0AAW0YS23_9TREE
MSDIDDEPPQLFDSSSLSTAPQAGPSSVPVGDIYDRRKVPITLLTGYLGAGKSTLLQYILTAEHGYKIAVCMNDFGDTTDIEAKSLMLSDPTTQTTSSSFLSLPNGCLCCSVKEPGIAAIEEMVATAPGGVDWVVVELTGVADPGPIVRTFWANEEMGDLILDGVICVVDSRNVLKQLSEERAEGEINECQKQVACADVILLNKVDLVTPEQLSNVEKSVRTLNPTLRVHHTTQSRMPLGELFNIRAFTDSAGSGIRESQLIQANDTRTCHDDETCQHDHNHGHSHDYNHEEGEEQQHLPHHSRITTTLVPLPSSGLTKPQFTKCNEFLESILWAGKYPSETGEEAPNILRTKGYIVEEDGTAHVLQGVEDLFELKAVPAAMEDAEEGGSGSVSDNGKVVFIGRGVGEGLKARFIQYVGLE